MLSSTHLKLILLLAIILILLTAACDNEKELLQSAREAKLEIMFRDFETFESPTIVRNGIPRRLVALLHSREFDQPDATTRITKWICKDTTLGKIVFDASGQPSYLQTGAKAGVQEITAILAEHQASLQFEVSPIELVQIPGDTFLMGTDEMITEYLNEAPVHKVVVSSFAIGKYEVTNREYKAFLEQGLSLNKLKYFGSGSRDDIGFYSYFDNLPYLIVAYSKFKESQDPILIQPGFEDHPVSGVTWHGAQAFAQHYGLRLPTEAEWEYACRAKTTTRFFFGDNSADLGTFAVCETTATARVGTKQPNPFGLDDLYGGVAEWCFDNYSDTIYKTRRDSITVNPSGPTEDTRRKVIRGGGYDDIRSDCRSARRQFRTPDRAFLYIGFRVVR